MFALAAGVMRQTQCCPSILMRFVLGRLNDLSERAGARRAATRFRGRPQRPVAAGLAGRLYVRRRAPDAAPPPPRGLIAAWTVLWRMDGPDAPQ